MLSCSWRSWWPLVAAAGTVHTLHYTPHRSVYSLPSFTSKTRQDSRPFWDDNTHSNDTNLNLSRKFNSIASVLHNCIRRLYKRRPQIIESFNNMAQPIRNTPWFVVSLEASVDNQLLNLMCIFSNLKFNEQTIFCKYCSLRRCLWWWARTNSSIINNDCAK